MPLHVGLDLWLSYSQSRALSSELPGFIASSHSHCGALLAVFYGQVLKVLEVNCFKSTEYLVFQN